MWKRREGQEGTGPHSDCGISLSAIVPITISKRAPGNANTVLNCVVFGSNN